MVLDSYDVGICVQPKVGITEVFYSIGETIELSRQKILGMSQ
jgi:hypothetical protein